MASATLPLSSPRVSVLIPVLNEQDNLPACLDCVVNQEYDLRLIEVVVIDAGSSDKTIEILREYQQRFSFIKFIERRGANIPRSLNLGAAEANGDVIVRVDARARPEKNYVMRLLHRLSETGVFHVGGKICATGRDDLGKIIGYALMHPFGVGNSKHRTSTQSTFREGGYLGGFWRTEFLAAGGYDEQCAYSEDDELAFRIVRMGHRILFEPEIRIPYVARSSLKSLWLQFFRYGRYKQIVLRKHGRLPSMRHYVPLLALLTFIAFSSLLVLDLRFRFGLVALALVYAALSLGFSAIAAIEVDWKCFFALPIVFATLHLSYALGSLAGAVDTLVDMLARRLWRKNGMSNCRNSTAILAERRPVRCQVEADADQ